MKLQMMNERSYFVSLPNAIVRAKGWKKGEVLKAEIDKNGDILIKK